MAQPQRPAKSPPTQPRAVFLGLEFIRWLMIVTGFIALVYWTAWPAAQWFTAQGWQETPCRIVESAFKSSVTMGYRGIAKKKVHTRFRYTYTVDGTPYEAKRFYFSSMFFAPEMREYPEGKRTVCYVNPKDPTQAVLSRKFHRNYLHGLIGLLLFVFAHVAHKEAVSPESIPRRVP